MVKPPTEGCPLPGGGCMAIRRSACRLTVAYCGKLRCLQHLQVCSTGLREPTTKGHRSEYMWTLLLPADVHAPGEDALRGEIEALTRRPGILMLGTLPVALTTARCSRDSRLARAVLFWMMSGPPMASSIGRFSLVSLGFWLICAAGWVCSSAPA